MSGSICYAQNELLKEKEQVHFTEHVLYGDKSVVEGVTVETNIDYSNQLFWNTSYVVGEEPKEETDYIFYAWDYDDDLYIEEGSMWFSMESGNIDIGVAYEKDQNYQGLEKAMKELYDNTSPGTENRTTVYLRDYVEYYPFMYEMHLPYRSDSGEEQQDMSYVIGGESELREQIETLEKDGTAKEELARLKKYLADLESFRAFFKIPVLEEEAYTLAIAKDEKGKVIGVAESSFHGGSAVGQIDMPNAPRVDSEDSFDFNMQTVFCDEDCYFTFDPHTWNGNLVDVSQIPGGYGLYHFTYDSKKGSIDVSTLEMVYPLDVEDHLVDIKIDGSGKNLLLVTEDQINRYLSVIDRETMTLVDSFTIGNIDAYYESWVYEDFLVIRSNYFIVFPLGEDGRYTQAFAVDYQEMEDLIQTVTPNIDFISWDSTFDWNGNTLVVADNIQYVDEELRAIYTCDFYVAAVDETGLVYYGKYDSSLGTSDVSYDGCRIGLDKQNPIRVYWSK